MKRASLRRGCQAPITIAALCMLCSASMAADSDVRITTPTVNAGGYTSHGGLTGTDLGKMIQDALGKDNYQQINIILNTCHSGAGLASTAGQLTGPHNVIAACGEKQTVLTLGGKEPKGFLPGFMDQIIGDPETSVDKAVEEGTKNDPKNPATAQEEARLRRLYEAERKFWIDKGEDATKWPDWDQGGKEIGTSKAEATQSADNPGQKKLAAGTSSNHAVIYLGYDGQTTGLLVEKTKEALKKAGFDSIDVLTPVKPADYVNLDQQIKDGKPPTVPDDRATPENLRKRLDSLKAVFNKDEALTVVVISHGDIAVPSGHSSNRIGPLGGRLFDAIAGTDRLGDQFTSTLLAEEAISAAKGGPIVDFAYYDRWDAPRLLIQTVEERNASGMPVEVLLNGLVLGSMQLDHPDGGFHEFVLDDAFIERLIRETDHSLGFDLRFSFAGPEDWFRLATKTDIDLMTNDFGHHGISLLFSLDGAEVPIPTPLALLLLPLGGLLGRPWAKRVRRMS